MIDAYRYDGKLEGIKEIRGQKGNIWADCTNISKKEAEEIQEAFNLHPLTTEDLLNQTVRIKVEEFPEYILCVFYCLDENGSGLMEMDFILGERFLITNHRKPMETFEDLKKDHEKLSKLFQLGLDRLFHKLLDSEIDSFFPAMERIEDQIEKLEEKVIAHPTSALLARILELKRAIVKIKRTTLPQREKISFLAKNEYKLIAKKSLPYFRDIYDHAIRVSDKVDNARDQIGNAFDVYMSTISNQMNEVMKTLSIIATIALPLTVISGIYGTNFSLLPGSGNIFGFWWMIIGMGLLSMAIIMFFRRRGWF